jgi:hypothetical protein
MMIIKYTPLLSKEAQTKSPTILNICATVRKRKKSKNLNR